VYIIGTVELQLLYSTWLSPPIMIFKSDPGGKGIGFPLNWSIVKQIGGGLSLLYLGVNRSSSTPIN
jgi:hypothetical protein